MEKKHLKHIISIDIISKLFASVLVFMMLSSNPHILSYFDCFDTPSVSLVESEKNGGNEMEKEFETDKKLGESDDCIKHLLNSVVSNPDFLHLFIDQSGKRRTIFADVLTPPPEFS